MDKQYNVGKKKKKKKNPRDARVFTLDAKIIFSRLNDVSLLHF